MREKKLVGFTTRWDTKKENYLQLFKSRDDFLHQLGHLVWAVQVDQLFKLLIFFLSQMFMLGFILASPILLSASLSISNIQRLFEKLRFWIPLEEKKIVCGPFCSPLTFPISTAMS